MKLTTFLNRIALGTSLCLLMPVSIMAEEITCPGFLSNTTVDNLLVPANSDCNLNGTRVMGTIKVEANATLNAEKIIVVGNVQAENALQVNILNGSRIGGSVQVKQGSGANVSDSFIDSDIQYDSNMSLLQVLRSTVGGNVQVVQNTGGVEIEENTIDGNLQCKENTPAPVGGGNIVQGSKEDQCRQLSGHVTTTPPRDKCNQSHPSVAEDTNLHIPRVSVITPSGVEVYWATLRFAPELSRNGNLVFELANPATNLGRCD